MKAWVMPMARASALLTALSLAGCGAGFSMEPPPNFVKLDEDDSSYEMRSTNAHGVVLAVRAVDNDPEGSLPFWVDAVKNRVRTLGGYALLEEKDVKAASGHRGKQLRFGRDEHGTSYFYWLTLYVTDDRVFVIEAGGRGEDFEAAKKQVEQAIARFRIG